MPPLGQTQDGSKTDDDRADGGWGGIRKAARSELVPEPLASPTAPRDLARPLEHGPPPRLR